MAGSLTCAPRSARRTAQPEVVKIEDLPSPAVGDGQIRVGVTAAAVNFPDVLLVANEYQISLPTPFVPGSEYAGVVVEVGDGVTDPVVGDHVFGTGISGAFAEEVVVAADTVSHVPDGVDDRLAAAFGVAHRTAYHVLRSVASVQPGEELIVLGAGGGVGLAAVQLGVVLGATVTASRRRPRSSTSPRPTAPNTSSTTGRPTCARRSATPCPAAPTSSSTRSAATSPSRPCVRCAGAAGS